MTKRAHTLVAEIERDALDESVPLASALRKCIALGGAVDSDQLREWAGNELRGYQGETETPAYRIVAASIHVDAVTINSHIKGQRISPLQLPEVVQEKGIGEELPLRMGIGELEAALAGDSKEHIHMSLPGGADIARMLDHEANQPHQKITAVYWSVSKAAIAGVLDQVRTTLTELVAEIRVTVPDEKADPSKETLGNALTVALHGSPKARVTLTTSQSQGASTITNSEASPDDGEDPPFWTRNKVAAFIAGAVAVAAGLATVARVFLG
ncbi:hypothetical protein [Streptomyces sp. CRB46]|uniref:AbiTii domain-containing protein n=1 Tax=Streptomyces sp. CRB46 TaxID=2682613 RepID=UPI0018F3DBDD|nr:MULTISPECIES: hypothetical protein [Streptomyces]WMI62040.1 hypothetical protein RBH85_36870 [Streptomyces rochei]